MDYKKDSIQFEYQGKQVICSNVKVWAHPPTLEDPPDEGVEMDSITIEGIEIDWDDDNLVDEIFTIAQKMIEEEYFSQRYDDEDQIVEGDFEYHPNKW